MARRARRVVGGVAVDQHVDVGLDVGEHAPHHVALALVRLAPHHGAGAGARPRRCGRSNCCRRRRCRRRAARRGNRPRPCRWRPPRCSKAPAPQSGCGRRFRPRHPRFAVGWQHGTLSRRPRQIEATDRRTCGRRTCPLIIAFLSSRVPFAEIRRLALGRRHPIQPGRRHHRPPGRARRRPTWSGSTPPSCRAPGRR